MSDREIKWYELILTDVGEKRDNVLFTLRSRYMYHLSKEVVEQLLDSTPSTLRIIGMDVDDVESHWMVTDLQEAGATIELREFYTPFFGYKQYFNHWLKEHLDLREVYRFTYLPPNWMTPFSMWLWYDWAGKHYALAQVGEESVGILNTIEVAKEKLWTPNDEAVLTAWELFDSFNFWNTEQWSDSGSGIDGVT